MFSVDSIPCTLLAPWAWFFPRWNQVAAACFIYAVAEVAIRKQCFYFRSTLNIQFPYGLQRLPSSLYGAPLQLYNKKRVWRPLHTCMYVRYVDIHIDVYMMHSHVCRHTPVCICIWHTCTQVKERLGERSKPKKNKNHPSAPKQWFLCGEMSRAW